MSNIIKEFYENAKTMPIILRRKISRFEQNPDIQEEFEYWIQNRQFRDDGVSEQGYNAKKLASLSEYLDGEGAFDLLLELRENPERAIKRIQTGFRKK